MTDFPSIGHAAASFLRPAPDAPGDAPTLHPVQQQQARTPGLDPTTPVEATSVEAPARSVYHPRTVDALRLYQSCAKTNLRRIPDSDADQEVAGADEFIASEGCTIHPVTLVRISTRKCCAEQLAKAREIRGGMRAAAGQWQGEHAPMALARVQERLWLHREDRRSYLAAVARAAASAPPAATGEASAVG